MWGCVPWWNLARKSGLPSAGHQQSGTQNTSHRGKMNLADHAGHDINWTSIATR